MLIISVEIIRTIDEKELQETTKEKQIKTERSKGNRSYSERVRTKWFCCAFKLGFLQLICKASLIFKSNLELALLIILKQRELYESRHVAVQCRCLKIWDLCLKICVYYGNTYSKIRTIQWLAWPLCKDDTHIRKAFHFLSLIFLNIFTPPQHALTHIILFILK